MPWRPGLFETLIVLIIIVLLFGPGRISKIAKELGASLTAFKEGLEGEDKKSTEKKEDRSAEDRPDDPA